MVGNDTKTGLTIQPGKEPAKWLLLSIPHEGSRRWTVKKSPTDAVQDTELDDRDAKYEVDCEEQQRADDGDEYDADAHVKYFLLSFLVAPLHENKSENYGLKRNVVLEH